MKFLMKADPRARVPRRPQRSLISAAATLVLSLSIGACAPLFVSGHHSDVAARLELSFYGTQAYIPVAIPNPAWDAQKLQSLTYDLYLGDRKVTQGKADYDKPIDSRSELKVIVKIDIDESWLLQTGGFGKTGRAPYRLVGTALVGDVEVPVSVDGVLRMPGMRAR